MGADQRQEKKERQSEKSEEEEREQRAKDRGQDPQLHPGQLIRS